MIAPRWDSATHRATDGRDCYWCHTVNSWKPGDFQLDGPGHQPKAASCLACHEADRPKVAKFPDNQPVQTGHYGKDCVLCHEPPVPKFVFTHVDSLKRSVSFCLPCHQAVGQAAHAANPEYFTPNNGDGNCQTCHNSSAWK